MFRKNNLTVSKEVERKKMKKYFFVILCFLFVFPTKGIPQGFEGEKASGGIITGRVVTASSGQPMEYVNIILYDKKNQTQRQRKVYIKRLKTRYLHAKGKIYGISYQDH
ncbi:MAG: hypothetical protein B5M53_01235 [Candidatus Cloacimonas sp. 4484_209]|nr:MAG: hypothetical protein B5M53_01235 [Candidatus Cloacimonas sp. 4484_209]